MSKAPRTTPTERITGPDWEDGEYCVVRTYLGELERRAIQDAALRVSTRKAGVTVHPDRASGLTAQVLAGVVEAHITYSDGSLIPLSEEGVRAWPAAYLDYVVGKLDEYWSAWQPAPAVPKAGQSQEAAEKAARFPVEPAGPRLPRRHAASE